MYLPLVIKARFSSSLNLEMKENIIYLSTISRQTFKLLNALYKYKVLQIFDIKILFFKLLSLSTYKMFAYVT